MHVFQRMDSENIHDSLRSTTATSESTSPREGAQRDRVELLLTHLI